MAYLDPMDRERRFREEIGSWSRDQYQGDFRRRLEVHINAWRGLHEPLGLTRGQLPIPPGPLCLVGCGHGGIEWPAAEDYPDREIDAVDLVIPEPKPEYWRLAEDRFGPRLHYYPGRDIQKGLPRNGYAAIIPYSILHHVPDIETAAKVMHDAMAPDGILLVEEYVGEPGISATEQRYRVAERIWQALPNDYKRKTDGAIQQRIHRHSAESAGGFEAISSNRIIPALKAYFETISEKRANALTGYRCIVWGEFGIRRCNPDIDRLISAFDKLLMDEGWLQGEDWTALLRKRG